MDSLYCHLDYRDSWEYVFAVKHEANNGFFQVEMQVG